METTVIIVKNSINQPYGLNSTFNPITSELIGMIPINGYVYETLGIVCFVTICRYKRRCRALTLHKHLHPSVLYTILAVV